jgi:hypothetical protein
MIETKHSFLFLAGLSVVTALSFGLFGVETAQAGCGWLDVTCKDSGIRQTGRDIDPTKHIPGSAAFAENRWGDAGGAGYPAAAQWMRANNGGSQGLDENQKNYLRPHFGGLVDQVVVIYNANLMDEWSALGMRVDVDDSAAQTYCNRIYVDDPYQLNDNNQLVLLAHELTHSKQCQQLGGEGKFGYHYFREYKRANQNYENNKLEKEAFDFENYFAGWFEEQIANSQAQSNPSPGSLASYHPDCKDNPQSPACVAAIHRACETRGASGGMSQEVGNGVFGVACFDTKWFGDVSIDDLRSKHPGCDSANKSRSSDCVAAIHRFCETRGAGGGISQEIGNGVLGVACFDTKWFGDISVR